MPGGEGVPFSRNTSPRVAAAILNSTLKNVITDDNLARNKDWEAIFDRIIEVALIVSVMVGSAGDKSGLARDTVFAAVMIICNGVVGLCLLVGGWHHREQVFRVQGIGPALAALLALSTLSLVLPTFTTSSAEGTYTPSQLIFVAISSLALWCAFTFFQTIRHRDYFLPDDATENTRTHAAPPSGLHAGGSLVALLVWRDADGGSGTDDLSVDAELINVAFEYTA